jgi:pyridoxal phosphate enzyme (YggS family)
MPVASVRAALAAGVDVLGESYAQEARAKRAELGDPPGVEWHFIGRVQRNKAAALPAFALVHSIGEARVATAVSRAATAHAVVVPVLIQVNLAGESTKEGTTAAGLPALLAEVRALAGVRVVGLMTMPPPLAPEQVRPAFRALRELRDRQAAADELRELSMGMSGDFEVAIEEGATLVRVGTAIFGPRPTT